MELKLDKIRKEIRGVKILDDISITLKGGRIYGLWGKNGCGKTMLMRCIAGLIFPTSGKMYCDDTLIRKDIRELVSVGVLIENPAFLPEYTGYKNLKLLADINGTIDDEDIRNAISSVGLDPNDKRKVRKYSLGMKQRLGIASAIMEKPDIILLDEPINAIDEQGVGNIRTLIRDMISDDRIIVTACHDREELKLLADEIIVMGEGGKIL